IGAPKIGQTPPAARPKQEDEPEESSDDEPTAKADEGPADHIPSDDDTYSPLHGEDDTEKQA
ncbi:MAG: hypothetical protein ACR2QL_08425, partial [Woeseiaceae bacterium]